MYVLPAGETLFTGTVLNLQPASNERLPQTCWFPYWKVSWNLWDTRCYSYVFSFISGDEHPEPFLWDAAGGLTADHGGCKALAEVSHLWVSRLIMAIMGWLV